MPSAPPPKAPPPKPSTAPPAPSGHTAKTFTSSTGIVTRGKRIGIYGSGGVGKTELANLLPKAKFIDLDEGTHHRDYMNRVNGVETWQDVLDTLRQASLWTDVQSVIIDSATRAEVWASEHTCKSNGKKSIEDFGYGKGYQFVYEAFLPLFAELDRHVKAGRNVCLVCHDCQDNVTNATGEDYKRYEPRMQNPSSGKASIRLLMKEWLDYLLFVRYDVAVTEKNKVKGAGTRTIYGSEMPDFWAKSRPAIQPVSYAENDNQIWKTIGLID